MIVLGAALLISGSLAHAQPRSGAAQPRPGQRGLAPAEIIPFDQIRPGMKGYGLTVFSGFKVERFKVEVIDVMHNFLPDQNLFLVRVEHPVIDRTGVIGGMSGSPVYLDGKLAGALAYGWRFAKEPVAGVTPIEKMLEMTRRKARGAGAELGSAGPGLTRGQRPVATRESLAALSRRERWWRLPFGRSAEPAPGELTPMAVPLNAAGLAPEAMSLLREAFEGYGFEPIQGGGTGRAEGPLAFEPGGSLGVQLIAGDMSLSSTGTVTWVKGQQVLAFGHQLFNAGEIYLPAVTARVNHSLANLSRSFKISSPARLLGTLVHDRQPGILAELGAERAGSVPVSVTMRYGAEKKLFRARMARHRLLTPTLATTVLSSALAETLADVTDTTFEVITRFTIKGYPPVTISDQFFATTGVRLTATLFSRGLLALRRVLENEFEPALIERVDFDVQAKFAREVLDITAVRIGSDTVDPGSRINVQVTFRSFGEREHTKIYPLEIPAHLGGSLLLVEVASGAQVAPDLAPPENLHQLLTNLQAGYPARAVIVSLQTPTDGLKLRGQVVRDLPPSVLDALNTSSQAAGEQLMRTVHRDVHVTRQVISGKRTLRIRVNSEVRQ